MEKKIRIGIIGMGAMGQGHYKNLKTIPEYDIKALSDIKPQSIADLPEEKFQSGSELINKAEIDAVLIATPHFDHVPLAIQALKKGLHVLVEKPIAVQTSEAKKLIDAHTDKSRVVACVFNLRTSPVFRKIKELVASGELGKIQRFAMTFTQWFRSEAYFKSAGWRATWAGEGGGALLNQCPHSLDILQWLVGMPHRINANIAFGKYHDIEVEDEVTAIFEYKNGLVGTFVASTGEAPGVNRIEIAGDRGLLIYENSAITFTRNELPTSKYIKETKEKMAKPPVWNISIPAKDLSFTELHLAIHKNFRDAILNGEQPVATLEDGVNSLDLANALLLSGFTGKAVTLPTDTALYDTELKKRIVCSRYKK